VRRFISIVVLLMSLVPPFPIAAQDAPITEDRGEAVRAHFATPITTKLFPDLVIPEGFERGFLRVFVNMSGRDIPRTVRDAEALLKVIPSERDRNLRALVLLELAVIHLRARENQTSWAFLDRVFDVADFDTGCFGRVLHVYGLRVRSRLQFMYGEFAQSWRTLQKALAAAQAYRANVPRCAIPARLAEGRVYEAIGRREYEAGNYDKALDAFIRAASIYWQLGARSNAEDFYDVVSRLDKLPPSAALAAYLEQFQELAKVEDDSPNRPGLVIETFVFRENLFLGE